MTWVLGVALKRLTASRIASETRLSALVDTLQALYEEVQAFAEETAFNTRIKNESNGAYIAGEFRHPFASLNLD